MFAQSFMPACLYVLYVGPLCVEKYFHSHIYNEPMSSSYKKFMSVFSLSFISNHVCFLQT